LGQNEPWADQALALWIGGLCRGAGAGWAAAGSAQWLYKALNLVQAGLIKQQGGVALPEIRLAGQIDALIDTPEALVVIDYKTGAVRDGSHVPQAYAAQLGLYRRLLMQLYPQREVRCYLVYTGGPHLVELSAAVMEKALSKIRA
jgi:ATP-dependent exoDNAse (exonuclease V) beta subunit